MSYTVLAVKWRPRRFADLLGQQHVVQALLNSLAAKRLHHAYLFTGTRGVGKTTVARILAKALNCEQGVVSEPCGVCDACVSIDQGRFVDLLEVDAASRTKVDDTRELLDNVQYAPSRGRFKVYLIDEVHMLSNHSFNALLKTLEEPPPHVKFLLATTDPQKLPITVLSRCLQFNLKRLTGSQIQSQLEKICAAEGVDAEADGLKALARAADGSVRDALSMLDQGIAFGGGEIKTEQVNAMLGTIDRGHVLRLLQALAAEDGGALLDEVAQLDETAPDYAAMMDELMSSLQQLAVIQLVGDRVPDEDLETLKPLADALSPEDVQLYYQIALQGKRDLPVGRDPRVGVEMTLLRMLAFRPSGDDASPAGRDATPQGRGGADRTAVVRDGAASQAGRDTGGSRGASTTEARRQPPGGVVAGAARPAADMGVAARAAPDSRAAARPDLGEAAGPAALTGEAAGPAAYMRAAARPARDIAPRPSSAAAIRARLAADASLGSGPTRSVPSSPRSTPPTKTMPTARTTRAPQTPPPTKAESSTQVTSPPSTASSAQSTAPRSMPRGTSARGRASPPGFGPSAAPPVPAQADLEKEPPEAPPWLDDYDSSPSDSGGPAPTGPLGTYDGGPAEAYDGSRSVPFEPPLQADDLEAARLQRGPTQVSNAASNAVDRSGKTGAVGEWATLIKAADLRGGARQLADHCEVASSTDKRIELILAADKETLNTQQLRTRLQDAIGQHLGMQVTLTVTSGKPPRPTPAEVRMANENARMRRARVSMEQDPNVKAAQDAFGAVLEADTIQPTGDD